MWVKVVLGNWRLALKGCLLLAAGAVLYLGLPYFERGRSAPLPWTLYAFLLVCISGGLASIAHSLAMHDLGRRYAITGLASLCGCAVYFWLGNEIVQCSRFASNFGISYPKVVCGVAFGAGAIWLAYLVLLFVTGFMRGTGATTARDSESSPPQ
jgi:hypothetical protein